MKRDRIFLNNVLGLVCCKDPDSRPLHDDAGMINRMPEMLNMPFEMTL
jgi:hypothetical protein